MRYDMRLPWGLAFAERIHAHCPHYLHRPVVLRIQRLRTSECETTEEQSLVDASANVWGSSKVHLFVDALPLEL